MAAEDEKCAGRPRRSRTVSALFESAVSTDSVRLTHVHSLVLLVKGGADEPAAAPHRLKREQIESLESPFEEKTPRVSVGSDGL